MSDAVPENATALLWEIEQIKKLKARYFRLMDGREWDAWGDVLTERCEIAVDHGRVLAGREAIVKAVRAGIHAGISVHHGHMPEIEITGPTTATGIWAMFDYVETPDRADREPVTKGYGHYLEEYEKGTDGMWRVSRLTLERLRVDLPAELERRR